VDKQQKLKIAFPILLVVMAFVWGPVLFGSGSKGDNDKGNVSQNVKTQGADLVVLSRVRSQKKARTTHAEWGQNPFMLKRAQKALYIEGIMWDAKDPKAIINGNIVGAGDVVENKTIVEVKPNSVIIKSDGGEEVELRFNE